MGERTVTDEQLEALVNKRLAERKEAIAEVLSELQPTLDGMRREIANANHIKRTLGRQLTRVENLVTQTAAEVRTHAQLPFHPAGTETIQNLTTDAQQGIELLEQFGVENLSLEEKQALPSVLGGYVRDKKDRKTLERRQDRRIALWLFIATGAGSVFGGILAGVAVIAFLASHGHPGFGG